MLPRDTDDDGDIIININITIMWHHHHHHHHHHRRRLYAHEAASVRSVTELYKVRRPGRWLDGRVSGGEFSALIAYEHEYCCSSALKTHHEKWL